MISATGFGHSALRFRTGWSRVLLITLTSLGLVRAVVATPGPVINDANIREAIENEILFDAGVPLDDIDVASANGIVTLTGTVDNVLAKDRAARIARTVKGGRSVVNRIDVQPIPIRSDVSIERDIRNSLLSDPATDSYEVGVSVTNGIATLSGVTDSWQEKQLAETVAKSVKGVTDVVNNVEVEYSTERTDLEIQNDIEESLDWDVLVDHGLIDVTVTNGNVSLGGIVGSAAEKRRAISDAWVAGVSKVEAQGLEVARWARDDDLRDRKYAFRSDEDIRAAVQDTFLLDPRVNAFDIDTAVDAGRVMLRGDVDYLKAKRAAQQNAKNTVGVVDVINRIKVRPVETFDDVSIRLDVNDALLRDPVVAARLRSPEKSTITTRSSERTT